MAVVMYLLSPPGKLLKDVSWNNIKKVMGSADQFLQSLIKYDKEHIPDTSLKAVKPIIADENFNGEFIKVQIL